MPFTVSPGTYQGGQYLYGGLSSLGQNLAQGIKDYQDTQSKLAGTDFLVQHAYQAAINAQNAGEPPPPGSITLEELNKYQSMSGKQKLAFGGEIASQFARDIQMQQAAAQEENRKAMAQYRQALADQRQQAINALQWSPTDADRLRAQQMGYDYTFDPAKGFVLTPYQGDGSGGTNAAPVARKILDENKNETGLLGITLPGTRNPPQIIPDPTQEAIFKGPNGLWLRRTPKGPVPLSPSDQQLMLQNEMQAQALQQGQQQPANLGQRLSQAWRYITSGQVPGGPPAPTPMPSATPAAAVPATVGAGAAGGAGGQGQLTPDIAQRYMNQAAMQLGPDGGTDINAVRNLARQLAQADGYQWPLGQ